MTFLFICWAIVLFLNILISSKEGKRLNVDTEDSQKEQEQQFLDNEEAEENTRKKEFETRFIQEDENGTLEWEVIKPVTQLGS